MSFEKSTTEAEKEADGSATSCLIPVASYERFAQGATLYSHELARGRCCRRGDSRGCREEVPAQQIDPSQPIQPP